MVKKILFPLVLAMVLYACTPDTKTVQTLGHRADSLSLALTQMRPGLGEYMQSVQMHHNKLWYAGRAGDWDLAGFELDEIKEQITHARLVNTDRVEVKSLNMLDPFIDSLTSSVKSKDTAGFRRNFTVLTEACNSCHKSVHFEFIKIKVPDQPMFTNQVW